ncbi:MAG TPA: ATP-binding protein, partial [Thermotogota bacterium]|nr:ATP-binding protein [Thermotogota bacterium]
MRYETKSTIVTANLNFGEWNKIFRDQALTIAILDRMTQNALIKKHEGQQLPNEKIIRGETQDHKGYLRYARVPFMIKSHWSNI